MWFGAHNPVLPCIFKRIQEIRLSSVATPGLRSPKVNERVVSEGRIESDRNRWCREKIRTMPTLSACSRSAMLIKGLLFGTRPVNHLVNCFGDGSIFDEMLSVRQTHGALEQITMDCARREVSTLDGTLRYFSLEVVEIS